MSELDDLAKELNEDFKYLADKGLPIAPPPAFISLTPEFLARIDEIETRSKNALAHTAALGELFINDNMSVRQSLLREFVKQLKELNEIEQSKTNMED